MTLPTDRPWWELTDRQYRQLVHIAFGWDLHLEVRVLPDRSVEYLPARCRRWRTASPDAIAEAARLNTPRLFDHDVQAQTRG